jgi:hypothetical protein
VLVFFGRPLFGGIAHFPSASRGEPQLDQAADGFRPAGLVVLMHCPTVDLGKKLALARAATTGKPCGLRWDRPLPLETELYESEARLLSVDRDLQISDVADADFSGHRTMGKHLAICRSPKGSHFDDLVRG